MRILDRLPWDILGPLIFLLVAAGLVVFCPEEDKGKLIFLIVGAALTRVKKVAPTVVNGSIQNDPKKGND